MHPILARQLKRLFSPHPAGEVTCIAGELQAFLEQHGAPQELVKVVDGLADFCVRIDSSYAQFERDLELRTRSLHLSSTELLGINEQLRNSLASREMAIGQLQSMVRRLHHTVGSDSKVSNTDPDSLTYLLGQVSDLIDTQQANQTAMRALHQDLANQKFALDQHAIVSLTRLDGTIVYANDRFCEISGHDREDLLGTNHLVVNSDLHPPAFFADIRQTLRDGKVWHGEFRNRNKNGGVYWLNATIVPLVNADSSLNQYISICTDITELKRIEQERVEAKNAAETANRAKSEFLSCMSHELRTPMNVILGFAQLLEATALTPDQAESLGEISKAGRHLLDLINEVLDLARIESGRIDLTPELLSVGELIGECVSLIKPMADSRQISVTTPAGGEARLLPVFADRLRLRQVLFNLLSNAIKYNRTGGKIDIASDAADGQVRVVITDSGHGIAPELLPRLFRPFERLSPSPYLVSIEGTGIGLALSKQLIEAMGGAIGVHSEPDVGSTFWISLPGAPDAGTQPSVTSTDAAPIADATACAQARTLLYVEDNPANLRLVQKIIARRANITLLDAPTAEIGLTLAADRIPDLILMDVNLPGMNGFEALRHLRENPATHSIPVIAVSANAMRHDIERALATGFDDYLTKPIDVSRLLALIDSFQDQSSNAHEI